MDNATSSLAPDSASSPGGNREIRATAGAAWSHRRFFELLRELGALRIISASGASTFEAICRFDAYGIAREHMNAITPAYHWHLSLARFRHLRSCDEVHARSSRRVLFFELRERTDSEPFLHVYLYRDPGADFDAECAERFAQAHAELAGCVLLAAVAGARS